MKRPYLWLGLLGLFLACPSAPPSAPHAARSAEPEIPLLETGRLVRWGKPTNWEPPQPVEGFLVVYGLGAEAPNPDQPGVQRLFRAWDEELTAWLEPYQGSGDYRVRVGVYDKGKILLWSRVFTVALQAAPPPPPAPSPELRRIEVRFESPRLLFFPFGEYPLGFKIVWSKRPDPVYPPRIGDLSVYRSIHEQREVWLTAFDGPGEYYVRVFEFLGDEKTGIVSEMLKVDLR